MALGACLTPEGVRFSFYVTAAREVAVKLYPSGDVFMLERGRENVFSRTIKDAHARTFYTVLLDGEEVPDPFARFLPSGVHGTARVEPTIEEPALGLRSPLAGIYELHVGTFTKEGTYRAAIDKLDALVELGIDAIELMPLAAFPGTRGWGYDGVAWFAPFAHYGEPDDLRAFVRAAHARGLGVILDVVYNHFGPAGNYLARYSPDYFTKERTTPWGDAPNFEREPMRGLVLDNVRYWLHEFGFDGLRLDATHEIGDSSILDAIVDVAHRMDPPRRIFFEDDRNDPSLVLRARADGVWADDLHHQLHVVLTHEREGYYAAYEPKLDDLARCIRDGWLYTGQPYPPWEDRVRGASARALSPAQLVTCIQNHDQIGNRALGTRPSEIAPIDRFAVAAMLLLFLPTTPILFMGQEWAATTPFLFFTDHEGDLGKAVTEGRHAEFRSFASFQGDTIPDPQAHTTFEQSKLVWEERKRAPHTRILDLHRAMLHLRRHDPVLSKEGAWNRLEARAKGGVLEVVRTFGDARRRLLANMSEEPRHVDLPSDTHVLVQTGKLDRATIGAWSAIVVSG
jgi:maltooligosyltrehalose trehalohydrolase